MNKAPFTPKEFKNDKEVRWCPGCGDYAILNALQRALSVIGLPPEKHVFVSGIGCAGRLPYYMNAYGLHTLHGRATAVATGLKTMRDDLSVWVITGDGDALSIGTNHLIHTLRRNVNVNILLVNNQVYGLTKGQFSPTSTQGQVTKTSPDGVNQTALNPLSLALSSGASFVARALDKDPKTLADILVKAHAHQGASFIEIYQDCHIFNAGAFDAFSQKTNRIDSTLELVDGKPMMFGVGNESCLDMTRGSVEITNTKPSSNCLHTSNDLMHALRLSYLSYTNFPVPIGIYYQKESAPFSLGGKNKKQPDNLAELYRAKATWEQ